VQGRVGRLESKGLAVGANGFGDMERMLTQRGIVDPGFGGKRLHLRPGAQAGERGLALTGGQEGLREQTPRVIGLRVARTRPLQPRESQGGPVGLQGEKSQLVQDARRVGIRLQRLAVASLRVAEAAGAVVVEGAGKEIVGHGGSNLWSQVPSGSSAAFRSELMLHRRCGRRRPGAVKRKRTPPGEARRWLARRKTRVSLRPVHPMHLRLRRLPCLRLSPPVVGPGRTDGLTSATGRTVPALRALGGFLALVWCVSASFGAVDAARTVLFIAGPPSHGPGLHEFPRGCTLLADALASSGLPVKAEVSLGWPTDERRVREADVVVLYSDGLADHVAKGQGPALRRRFDAGKALVVLHFALEAPEDDAELRAVLLDAVGGRFEAGWSVNPTWTVRTPAWPRHPVTRGMAAFEVEDEWYYHLRFRDGGAGLQPILSVLPPANSLGDDGPRSGNPTVRAALAKANRRSSRGPPRPRMGREGLVSPEVTFIATGTSRPFAGS
jgi:hypothetical protein